MLTLSGDSVEQRAFPVERELRDATTADHADDVAGAAAASRSPDIRPDPACDRQAVGRIHA